MGESLSFSSYFSFWQRNSISPHVCTHVDNGGHKYTQKVTIGWVNGIQAVNFKTQTIRMNIVGYNRYPSHVWIAYIHGINPWTDFWETLSPSLLPYIFLLDRLFFIPMCCFLYLFCFSLPIIIIIAASAFSRYSYYYFYLDLPPLVPSIPNCLQLCRCNLSWWIRLSARYFLLTLLLCMNSLDEKSNFSWNQVTQFKLCI